MSSPTHTHTRERVFVCQCLRLLPASISLLLSQKLKLSQGSKQETGFHRISSGYGNVLRFWWIELTLMTFGSLNGAFFCPCKLVEAAATWFLQQAEHFPQRVANNRLNVRLNSRSVIKLRSLPAVYKRLQFPWCSWWNSVFSHPALPSSYLPQWCHAAAESACKVRERLRQRGGKEEACNWWCHPQPISWEHTNPLTARKGVCVCVLQ